jgi:hypothetical protein
MKLRFAIYILLGTLLGTMLFSFLMKLHDPNPKLVLSPYKYEALKCRVQMNEPKEWEEWDILLVDNNNIICGKGEGGKTIPYASLTKNQKEDVNAFKPFTK